MPEPLFDYNTIVGHSVMLTWHILTDHSSIPPSEIILTLSKNHTTVTFFPDDIRNVNFFGDLFFLFFFDNLFCCSKFNFNSSVGYKRKLSGLISKNAEKVKNTKKEEIFQII